MSACFIRTDAASVGPFSDVELRELAYAGLLKPESLIATSADGNWLTAQSIELFSFQKLPVPHPQGTVVPHFEVQGLPAAFRGPFKLRELFGFAARGMLPPDALIKKNDWEDWLSVLQYPALVSCLNGELAMLSPQGQLVIRAAGNNQKVNLDDTCVPLEIARQAALQRTEDAKDRTPDPVIIDEGYDAEQATIQAAAAAAKAKAITLGTAGAKAADKATAKASSSGATMVAGQDRDEASWGSKIIAMVGTQLTLRDCVHRLYGSRLSTSLSVIALCLLVGGLAYACTRKPPSPNQPVIGAWICSHPDASSNNLGSTSVSLSEAGNCDVVNSDGTTWHGGYFYSEKHGMDRLYNSLMPQSSVVSAIEPHHKSDDVHASDGYIRLVSRDGTFPEIDGHRVSEAFIRIGENELRLGYLATVDWTADAKVLEAGWIKLSRERKDSK